MLSNRCIQRAEVIPVLAYPDVNEAADWLCRAFGFGVRLRIASHRVQLNVGDGGGVTLRELRPGDAARALGAGHSITIRVENADSHSKRAREYGAQITEEPVTHPFGERQYNAIDLAGHQWTFSESVADVDPAEFGWTTASPE